MNPQRTRVTKWRRKKRLANWMTTFKKFSHDVLLQDAQVLFTLKCVSFLLKETAIVQFYQIYCGGRGSVPGKGFLGPDTLPVFTDKRSLAARTIGIFHAKWFVNKGALKDKCAWRVSKRLADTVDQLLSHKMAKEFLWKYRVEESISVSEQLPTYPSPNPTLTLTCYQLTVVELGEG